MIDREQQDRRRQRLIASLISLALLLLLLSAWCAVSGEQQQGELRSLATGTVDVSVNPTGEAAAGSPTATGGLSSGFNRQSPLLTEVLGAQLGSPDEPPAEPSIEPQDEEPAEPDPDATEEPDPDASATAVPEGTAVVTETPEVTATAEALETPTPPPAGPPILTFDGLFAPGSYASGGVRVTNSGGAAFHYSVALTTEGDTAFAEALRFRIYTVTGNSCGFVGQPAVNQAPGLPPGEVLYSGNFATGNKIGDPTVEIAASDVFLGANGSMLLCMDLFFPWASGNEYQGNSIEGTFVFTAKTPE